MPYKTTTQDYHRQLSKQFWDRAILGQNNFRTKQFMDNTIYRQSKVMGFDPKVINLVIGGMLDWTGNGD